MCINKFGKKKIFVSLLVLIILSTFFGGHVLAINQKDYTVLLTANVQLTPPQITLNWATSYDAATQFTIYRKLKSDNSWGNSWGSSIATLGATATQYVDTNVQANVVYEYKVQRITSTYVTGYGYICTGINVEQIDSRGKMILLVDNSFANSLVNELNQLERDLVGDGWQVIRHDVSRTDTVQSVKSIIVSDYNSDPTNVKAVYLFGHIPIASAGNNAWAPDGHERRGWPSDGYYGDMDGIWTDVANDDAYNVHHDANDGCFDESYIPSDIELQVGRVDLYDMPAFSKSEEELLRQYLNKAHYYKFNETAYERKAIIKDDFNAYARGAFRSFSVLTGGNSAILWSGAWKQNTTITPYLWALSSSGGTYTGFGNGSLVTNDFETNEYKTLFNMSFGSYFGKWDVANNFLRAPLCQPNYGLTNVWGARPYWHFHHMGMGDNIGYSSFVNMNSASSQYDNDSFTRTIHISLMGDPSLRLYPVTPPSNGSAYLNTSNASVLNWNAPLDSILGYHIYRSDSATGPFTRLTSNYITDTTYTDLSVQPIDKAYYYIVKSVKLETSASGSYYNLSQGNFIVVDQNTTNVAPTPATIIPTTPPLVEKTPAFSDAQGNSLTVLNNADFVNAGIQYTNNTSSALDLSFITILYDNNKALKQMSFTNKNLEVGQSATLYSGFDVPQNSQGWSVKAFVWSDLFGLKPLQAATKLQ
jgi:hypothetical protein